MTTVVKVGKKNCDELLANPDFVWVGRRTNRLKMPASVWGNPFRVGSHYRGHFVNRRQAVHLFIRALDIDPEPKWEELRQLLPTLKGKILGCACCNWDGVGEPETDCHAVELAKRAEET